MDQPTPEQPAANQTEQPAGTLSQILGFGGSLIDKNDAEFKPLITVMVFSGLIFLGMLFYAYKTGIFSHGIGAYVFFGIMIFSFCIVGIACLTTIIRSGARHKVAEANSPATTSPLLTENDRDLLVFCKLAEKGLAAGTQQGYISNPFELKHDDVVNAFERLSRSGK